jgi:hypothetical protein
MGRQLRGRLKLANNSGNTYAPFGSLLSSKNLKRTSNKKEPPSKKYKTAAEKYLPRDRQHRANHMN